MENPSEITPPEGFQYGLLENENGNMLRYGHAAPEGGMRGAVVIVGGYNDGIPAHFETAQTYLDQGYAVWMWEPEGYGGSEPITPGEPHEPNPADIDDHVRDFDQFLSETVQHDPNVPLILHAHSFGGTIGMTHLHDHPEKFDGAVMAAPMLEFGAAGVPDGMTRLWAKMMPAGLSVAGPLAHQFWENGLDIQEGMPERLVQHKQHLKENPELSSLPPNWGFMAEGFEATDRMDEDFFQGIKVPVLMAIADDDDLMDPERVKEVTEQLPNGHFHDVGPEGHCFWKGSDHGVGAWTAAFTTFTADVAGQFHHAQNNTTEIVPSPQIDAGVTLTPEMPTIAPPAVDPSTAEPIEISAADRLQGPNKNPRPSR